MLLSAQEKPEGSLGWEDLGAGGSLAPQRGGLGAGRRLAYASGMQSHLEPLQVQPLLGLAGIQVMVEVPGGVPEAVELPLRGQQDGGRSLLVGHPGVAPFPSPDTKERQRLWDLPS